MEVKAQKTKAVSMPSPKRQSAIFQMSRSSSTLISRIPSLVPSSAASIVKRVRSATRVSIVQLYSLFQLSQRKKRRKRQRKKAVTMMMTRTTRMILMILSRMKLPMRMIAPRKTESPTSQPCIFAMTWSLCLRSPSN